jgi:hypothetical protein
VPSGDELPTFRLWSTIKFAWQELDCPKVTVTLNDKIRNKEILLVLRLNFCKKVPDVNNPNLDIFEEKTSVSWKVVLVFIFKWLSYRYRFACLKKVVN